MLSDLPSNSLERTGTQEQIGMNPIAEALAEICKKHGLEKKKVLRTLPWLKKVVEEQPEA